jgi:Fic-DOC domain mobile mystery protein B
VEQLVNNRQTRPGKTPIADISGLRIKGITTRSELDVAEAENIRKAMVKYFGKRLTRRTARFDLAWTKRLHKEMFGAVWNWAGEFRTYDLNLGIPWRRIENGLQVLLENLASWDQYGVSLLEQAVKLHYESVSIHPFRDGNGRWSRMLANIWLRVNRHPITEWPVEISGGVSKIRGAYLAAIKRADQGDYAPLLEMHRRYSAS